MWLGVPLVVVAGCAPSRAKLQQSLSRGASESSVIEMLGQPMAKLPLTAEEAFFWKLAVAPCRPERISEAWPYHFRLSGAVVVFMDSGHAVECVVRMDDWGEGKAPIARIVGWPPNIALQLTKPAQAMELRS